MRITVKKKEKKQCKPAGLMALVLALILLAGMVPEIGRASCRERV